MKKLVLALCCTNLAWAAAAQVAPKLTDARQVDADANGKASPGTTLHGTITITNTSTTNWLNVQIHNPSFRDHTLDADFN